jgi:hypothetical protein
LFEEWAIMADLKNKEPKERIKIVDDSEKDKIEGLHKKGYTGPYVDYEDFLKFFPKKYVDFSKDQDSVFLKLSNPPFLFC